MASASGWAKRGRKLRTNVLKVSFNWRRASEAMVSKTMDDLPDPDTPVKIVILRFGMRNDTFFRLFSRAPRIVTYSWDTIRSFSYLTIPQTFPKYIVSGVEYHPSGSADPNVKFKDGKGNATKLRRCGTAARQRAPTASCGAGGAEVGAVCPPLRFFL